MNMSSEHIVRAFDEELQRLSAVVLRMGGVAEAQLASAIEALVRRDSELAQNVIAGAEGIDQKDIRSEERRVGQESVSKCRYRRSRYNKKKKKKKRIDRRST